MFFAAPNSFTVPSIPSYGTLILIVALLGYVIFRVSRVVFDPLRHIPGAFAARFTRLWEFEKVTRGDFERTHILLHEKYGNFLHKKLQILCPNLTYLLQGLSSG